MNEETSYSVESLELAEQYKTKIIEILKSNKIDYGVDEIDQLTFRITITMYESVLEYIISPKWIGYRLSINPNVVGKPIGIADDTDLYPLDYDIDATKEIGEEALCVLQGLINGAIYVGTNGDRYYIAVPLTNGTYKLKSSKKFSSTESIVTYEELEQMEFIKKL